MAAASWKKVYPVVRKGIQTEPADTSRGISQALYAAWCQANGSPAGDVHSATEATIEQIHFSQNWMPYGNMLPGGIDAEWFDIVVNKNQPAATQILQEALGVKEDGYIGLLTIQAAMNSNRLDIIPKISGLRIKANPDWTNWVVYFQELALSLV
jgi:lysozyme family protein